MVKLNFLHTSDQAMISNDGKLSIIGLFVIIKTRLLPAIHSRFNIVTNITGDPGEYKQTIEIISLDDNQSVASVNGISEIKGVGGNTFIGTFINILFKTEGKYWIKVLIEGNNYSKVVTNKNDHFILVEKTNR